MLKQNWFDRRLPIINKLLLTAIILINAYIILLPFLPKVSYEVSKFTSDTKSINTPEERKAIDRSKNHVVIPSMNLNEFIWVGNNEKLVNKGIWHIPHSSTPDKGSNTVLVGHRFTYKNTAVLYHLDKVKTGDPITVAWDGKLYNYVVSESKIVKPSDVYVEDPTEDSILTIYTCNPVWSTRERLVVVARLESVE